MSEQPTAQLLPAFPRAARPESAGEHAVTAVPVALAKEEVSVVLSRLREQRFLALEAVFVVGDDGELLGAVRLTELLCAPSEQKIAELVDRGYPRVGARYDQEHAAALALRKRATSIAVVDDAQRLIGAMPASALLDVLRREHVEDLHRIAGIEREHALDRHALEAPPTRRARHRLPWLLSGLLGSMLAALVVSRYERVLQEQLALAFFVPVIVYLADAIGTQTEAIVVRGLSLSRQPLRTLLGGELRTGLLIGFTLAVCALPLVGLSVGDFRIGLAVAVAILLSGAVATTIGLLLPWLFQRAQIDPAFGSGPIATILQDVLSLLIYFAIATLIVR